jgi:glucose/arabinose dehydrogenase
MHGPRSRLTKWRRIALALGSALAAIAPSPAFTQMVPTGFQIQSVVGGPFAPQVSGFAFLADGRVVILEKDTGNVRLAAVGAGTSVVIATVTNLTIADERGLLGVAVDPGWPARPYVYVLYTHTGGVLHLVLYTATGDLTAPASTNLQLGAPFLVLDDLPDLFDNHNGGTLRFGPDGFLYVSVGDDSRSCDAQDASMHLGKILRLDVSGLPTEGSGPPPKSALVAAGNPYSGSDNARLVFALGLRNPFRFSLDPLTNDLYIGDVGLETWEEVDALAYAGYAGANLGWPEFEGPLQDPWPPSANCSTAPFTAPIYFYPNPAGGAVASVVCGPLYRAPPSGAFSFPSAYDGDLFLCEFYAGWMRRLERGPSGWALAAPVPGQPNANDWATSLGNIADLQVGPDGALYILVMFNAGFLPRGLHRIVNTLPSDAGGETGVAATGRLGAVFAHPNPARVAAGAQLWLVPAALPTSMPQRVRILDVAGRVVRELPLAAAASATRDLSAWSAWWDGRTSHGAAAAPGVYLVEFGTGASGAIARGKMALVR